MLDHTMCNIPLVRAVLGSEQQALLEVVGTLV